MKEGMKEPRKGGRRRKGRKKGEGRRKEGNVGRQEIYHGNLEASNLKGFIQGSKMIMFVILKELSVIKVGH